MSIQPLKVACKRQNYFKISSKHTTKKTFTSKACNAQETTPYHLKQRQVALSNVVVVDFDVDPASLLCGLLEGRAFTVIVNLRHGEKLPCGGVDTTVKLPSKQINSHDAEDEPENQTHQQHVEDGGNRSNERVHHNLSERNAHE